MKEGAAHQVYEMLPKIAKDFLHHHGQGKLSDSIQMDKETVTVVQLNDKFYVTNEPMGSMALMTHVKLVETISAPEGAVRIYGLMAEDQAKLKELTRRAQAFFENRRDDQLEKKGYCIRVGSSFGLTMKAMRFRLEALESLENVLSILPVRMVQGDMNAEKTGIAKLEPCLIESTHGPLCQRLYELKTNRSLCLEHILAHKSDQDRLQRFIPALLEWVDQQGVGFSIGFEGTSDMRELGLKLTSREPATIRELKGKGKFQIKIELTHPLGFSSLFLTLVVQIKSEQYHIKLESLMHPELLLVWKIDSAGVFKKNT
jgi:hypothetical protein